MNERLNPLRGTGPWPCNQNLLDNWYFVNPVNQRGNSVYAVSGYTVDRWRTWPNGGAISIIDGAVRVGSVAGATCFFAQRTDCDVDGKLMTLSFLSADGRLLCGSGVFPEKPQASAATEVLFSDKDGRAYFEHGTDGIKSITFTRANGASIDLIAAKLEPGSVQTLAHKEGDEWVLNEIPDYGEQIAKCQRYQLRFSNCCAYGYVFGGRIFFSVPTPAEMRIAPKITDIVSYGVVICNGVSYVPASFSVNSTKSNSVIFSVPLASSGISSDYPCIIYNFSFIFDANL